MKSNGGYTLTEMMVGLTCVGLVAAASVPNIQSFMRSTHASNGVQELSTYVRMARSKAVMEGNDYLVQFPSTSTYVLVDDDGGGNGLPGAAGYVASNRGNGKVDAGERTWGPFQLPGDLVFAAASGATNPFTGQPMDAAVTFPLRDGKPTLTFKANGTAESSGFVAMAPNADVARQRMSRATVLQVLSSTGGLSSRAVGSGG